MHSISLILCLVALVATVDQSTAEISVGTPAGPPADSYVDSAIGIDRSLIANYPFECYADGPEGGYVFRSAYIRHENDEYGINITSSITGLVLGSVASASIACGLYHMSPPPFTQLGGYCSGLNVNSNSPDRAVVIPVGLVYRVTYICEWTEGLLTTSPRHRAESVFEDIKPMWAGPYSFDDPEFIAPGTFVGYLNVDHTLTAETRALGLTFKTSAGAQTGLFQSGYSFVMLFDSPDLPSVRYRVNYDNDIDTENPAVARLVIPYARLSSVRAQYALMSEPPVYPGHEYRVRIWMQCTDFAMGIAQIYDDQHFITPGTFEPATQGPVIVSPRYAPRDNGQQKLIASVSNGDIVTDIRWWTRYDTFSLLRFVFFDAADDVTVIANFTYRHLGQSSLYYTLVPIPMLTDRFVSGVHDGFADIVPGVYNMEVSVYMPEIAGWSASNYVYDLIVPPFDFPTKSIQYNDTVTAPVEERPESYARTGMVKGFFVVVELPRIYVYDLSRSHTQTIHELDDEIPYYTMSWVEGEIAMFGSDITDITITDDGVIVFLFRTSFVLYPISVAGVVTELANTAQNGGFINAFGGLVYPVTGPFLGSDMWPTIGTTQAMCVALGDSDGVRCARLSGMAVVPGSAFTILVDTISPPPLPNGVWEMYPDVDPTKIWVFGLDYSTGFRVLCLVNTVAQTSACRSVGSNSLPLGSNSQTVCTIFPDHEGVRLLMVAKRSDLGAVSFYPECDSSCMSDPALHNVDLLYTAESIFSGGPGYASATIDPFWPSPFTSDGKSQAMEAYTTGVNVFGADPKLSSAYIVASPTSKTLRVYDVGHLFRYQIDTWTEMGGFPTSFTSSIWFDATSNTIIQVGANSRMDPTIHAIRFYSLDVEQVELVVSTVTHASYATNDLPIDYVITTIPVSGSIYIRLQVYGTEQTFTYALVDADNIQTTLATLISEYNGTLLQHATGGAHHLETMSYPGEEHGLPDGNFTVFVGYTDLESGTVVETVLYYNVLLYMSTTESPDCSNNGFKVLASCTCFETHYGPVCNQTIAACSAQHCPESYECTPTIAGNFSCIIECPTCGDNGFCNELHTCTCYEGWNGTLCTVSTCDFDCGIHGECGGDDCDCDEGWTGDVCEIPICPNCNGNGNCVEGSGVCTCDEGWSGSFCDMECPDCGVNSVCTDGECVCTNSWTGTLCTIAPCPSCGAHGSCVGVACVCTGGWTGTQCQLAPCQLHSSRVNGTCTCDSGYFGSDCSCTASCGSHGACTNTTCICGSGYYGPTCAMSQSSCDSIVCHEDDMICSTSTVDNTTIVCVDPPVLPCHCHHDGVCANETDADSCTCATGTFGPYCNMTAATCATAHCGLPLVAHSCAETVNGTIACIAPVIEADGFNEENYYFIGAGFGAAIAIGVVAFVISYVNSRVRGNEFDRLRETGGAEGF